MNSGMATRLTRTIAHQEEELKSAFRRSPIVISFQSSVLSHQFSVFSNQGRLLKTDHQPLATSLDFSPGSAVLSREGRGFSPAAGAACPTLLSRGPHSRSADGLCGPRDTGKI